MRERIPVPMDDLRDLTADAGWEVGWDRNTFVEFGLVDGGVPFDNISAVADHGEGGSGQSSSIGAEDKEILVDVVITIVGDKFAGRSGSPYFWRDSDKTRGRCGGSRLKRKALSN